MDYCKYRDKTCNYIVKECQLCLMGQQADELSLLNSAIGNLTASIEERLCKEEHE